MCSAPSIFFINFRFVSYQYLKAQVLSVRKKCYFAILFKLKLVAKLCLASYRKLYHESQNIFDTELILIHLLETQHAIGLNLVVFGDEDFGFQYVENLAKVFKYII